MSASVIEVMDRAEVERLVEIFGSNSAAGQAISCADEGKWGKPPVFFRFQGAGRAAINVTAMENVVPYEGDDR